MKASLVLDSSEEVGRLAAALVANRVSAFPDLRLMLPTGRTPKPMYTELRRLAQAHAFEPAQAPLLQLDEIIGHDSTDKANYSNYLNHELRGISFAGKQLLNGSAPDLDLEVAHHQQALDKAPIGLAVLGIGQSGHVAFNEPGSGTRSRTRLITLEDSSSKNVEGAKPEQAITVGIADLLSARELILLVTGREKANIFKRLLTETVSTDLPATQLLGHPRLTIICDAAAYGEIGEAPRSRKALVVLGNHHVGQKYGLSDEGSSRVKKAEKLALEKDYRFVILSGYTSGGRESEAQYMASVWRVSLPPLLLEEASTKTSENASYSLLLLVAAGVISEVTVVSSPSHIRARYFFAPLRKFGFHIKFAWSRYPAWKGLLHELRWAFTMFRERDLAMEITAQDLPKRKRP